MCPVCQREFSYVTENDVCNECHHDLLMDGPVMPHDELPGLPPDPRRFDALLETIVEHVQSAWRGTGHHTAHDRYERDWPL